MYLYVRRYRCRGKEGGKGEGRNPAVYKDESWFSDYRTGELFEGVSILLSGPNEGVRR